MWCWPIAARRPTRSCRKSTVRTGDKPFTSIDDVISREELAALSESYKRIAGYDKDRLKERSMSSQAVVI